jgi:type I restriction-modification system DNA methylase subunit
MMLPDKVQFIWESGFREDLLEINQSETIIACGSHVFKRIGTKRAILIEDLP